MEIKTRNVIGWSMAIISAFLFSFSKPENIILGFIAFILAIFAGALTPFIFRGDSGWKDAKSAQTKKEKKASLGKNAPPKQILYAKATPPSRNQMVESLAKSLICPPSWATSPECPEEFGQGEDEREEVTKTCKACWYRYGEADITTSYNDMIKFLGLAWKDAEEEEDKCKHCGYPACVHAVNGNRCPGEDPYFQVLGRDREYLDTTFEVEGT